MVPFIYRKIIEVAMVHCGLGPSLNCGHVHTSKVRAPEHHKEKRQQYDAPVKEIGDDGLAIQGNEHYCG
jgi:hypothetical protein